MYKRQVLKILDISSYVDGSKIPFEESGTDTAAWAYARSFSLLRLKPEELINKLNDKDVSPSVRQGVSLLILTALRSTTSHIEGSIPPKDLGFDEDSIYELIALNGNKLHIAGLTKQS